jgi:heme A synthase
MNSRRCPTHWESGLTLCLHVVNSSHRESESLPNIMSQSRARWHYLRTTISKTPVRYRHIAGFTLLVTYIVMLLGAYTSAIGAGLSCPDWPTCYGTWVPFLQPEIITNSPYSALQIFAEWAHRGLAMMAGVLIAGTTLGAWMTHRNTPIVKYEQNHYRGMYWNESRRNRPIEASL